MYITYIHVYYIPADVDDTVVMNVLIIFPTKNVKDVSHVCVY